MDKYDEFIKAVDKISSEMFKCDGPNKETEDRTVLQTKKYRKCRPNSDYKVVKIQTKDAN